MPKSLTATNAEGKIWEIEYDRDPDMCPRCHRAIHPKPLSHYQTGTIDDGRLEVVFCCPSAKCEHLFIATYLLEYDPETRDVLFQLGHTAPREAPKVEVSQEIRSVSPRYQEIYRQAVAAEVAGLNEIAGMGYRRALEFLIKDFTIRQHPDHADEIRRIMLGQCIDRFVDDTRVKECAVRASWLGNDEAHYERDWKDKDISHLKDLIRLTTHWIEGILVTQRYVTSMQRRRRRGSPAS